MKEKILALIFTLGNVFAGKRGDGIFFGWLGADTPDEPHTWSWVYPFNDWDVQVGVALQFPLLGLMRVYIHKETGKLRTFFKGFTPLKMEVTDDKAVIVVNDALTVTAYYYPAENDISVTVERGNEKLSFIYSNDPGFVSP